MVDKFIYGFGDELAKLAANQPGGYSVPKFNIPRSTDVHNFRPGKNIPKSSSVDPIRDPYGPGESKSKPSPGLNSNSFRRSDGEGRKTPGLGSLSRIQDDPSFNVMDTVSPPKRSKPSQEAWKRLEARKKKGDDFSTEEGISKFVGQYVKGGGKGKGKGGGKKPIPKPTPKPEEKGWPKATSKGGGLVAPKEGPTGLFSSKHNTRSAEPEGTAKERKASIEKRMTPAETLRGKKSFQESLKPGGSRYLPPKPYAEHLTSGPAASAAAMKSKQSQSSGLQGLARSTVPSRPYTEHLKYTKENMRKSI